MARWQPGQCGNPRGRPRVVGEIRDLARGQTEHAIEVLISVMRDGKASAAARIAAAREILDRGWGRPPQAEPTAYDRQQEEEAELELVLAELAEERARKSAPS